MKPSFSMRLRQALADKGMTQSLLAMATGINQQQIRRYTTGQCTPRLTTLKRLADALDMTPEELAPNGLAPLDLRDSASETVERITDRGPSMAPPSSPPPYHTPTRSNSDNADAMAEFKAIESIAAAVVDLLARDE